MSANTRTAPLTQTEAARAHGVSKSYGSGDAAVVALDDISVSLDAGIFTAIMGPSGSGKSTLLHVLAGLDRPDSGEVYLGDTEITSLSDRGSRCRWRPACSRLLAGPVLRPASTCSGRW
jgi:putative ABC transport system ATP-binding protein